MKKIFKNEKFKTWLTYSLIFSILVLGFLIIFYSFDKSLVWKDDALKQHFIILYDFNEMIRSFLANPLEGIKLFSFDIGLGADVIGQYSYYIIGDPVAYISLLFPMDKLEIGYIFLILLRMYLVGISFMIFGNYKKLKQKNILVGALIYTFSGFILYAGVRHPYFLNPVILFPLLLIGIDKLFKENRIFLLTSLVFLSLIINYYFFYMLTALIGIYTILKYIFEYKEKGIKFLFHIFLKLFISYLIACLLASVIFMPTLYAFFNSNRVGLSSFSMYDGRYYLKLLNGLITTESARWNVYGVSSIIILMLPLLFKNIKKNKVLASYLIVMLVILLSSKLGSLMNGLSFPNNRWIFAFSFLLAYIVAKFIDFDFKYTKKDIKLMIISFFIYFIGIICFNPVINKEILVMLVFCVLMLIVIIFNNSIRKYKIKPAYLLIGIIIFNLYFIGHFLYSLDGTKNYASEFIGYGGAVRNYNSMGDTISKYKEAMDYIKEDKSIYRISKFPCELENTSLYFNVKDISSFFSIGSKSEAVISKDLENREYNISRYIGGFDNRVKVTTLLGTKYFVADKKNQQSVPYGYERVKEINDKEKKKSTIVYKNKNQLGLGVFYDSYILVDEYDKLSPLNKEDSLLNNVSIDNSINDYNIKKGITKNIEQKIKYKLIDKNNIEKNKIIKTTEEEQSIELDIENVDNSEIYVSIKGLKFKPYTLDELKEIKLPNNYSKVAEKEFIIDNSPYNISDKYIVRISNEYLEKKEESFDSKVDPYYYDDGNILVNMGHYNNYDDKFEITFSSEGVYTYDSIEVIAVNMDDYDNEIKKLKETNFEISEFKDGYISGNIKAKRNGIIQITTPYSKGWTAFVDGKKTDTIIVNKSFIGIPLKKGAHKIVLKYRTPYLKEGIVLSIIGVISIAVLGIIERKKLTILKKNNIM